MTAAAAIAAGAPWPAALEDRDRLELRRVIRAMADACGTPASRVVGACQRSESVRARHLATLMAVDVLRLHPDVALDSLGADRSTLPHMRLAARGRLRAGHLPTVWTWRRVLRCWDFAADPLDLADLAPPPGPTLEAIEHRAGRAFGAHVRDMRSSTMLPFVSDARSTAAGLAAACGYGVAEAARALGIHHTSVVAARRRVVRRARADGVFLRRFAAAAAALAVEDLTLRWLERAR